MALGEALARPLIKLLVELGWCVDLVTPVPLGVARLSQRGYNQAALLARPLSLAHGLPYHTNALTKVRETRSQVGLSANERHQNVADAFKGDPRVSKGKCILVIDDVTTSGATLNACASALLQAGASRVYGLTLARTSSRPADRDAG
jgi:competence protein ComFC